MITRASERGYERENVAKHADQRTIMMKYRVVAASRLCSVCLPVLLIAVVLTSALLSSAEAAENFQDDVLPIFRQHCLSCHNADRKKAGLDLSSFQLVQLGSSGGTVVKAGLPDSSPLFMAVNHHEDSVAMPPNKPRLADAQLKVIHGWIAGGLMESAGGKSLLRDVSFSLAAGSTSRPEHPAMPIDLPEVPIADVQRPLPVAALASSPWVDLVAGSGHEQILLFAKQRAPIESDNFRPVASNDLISRRTFDRPQENLKLTAGKFGKALQMDGPELRDDTVPADVLVKHNSFTFSAWLKPDPEMQSPAIYGRESFFIMLERSRNGWRVRAMSRAANNNIHYTGRMGEFIKGDWQHVAVTCDGKEWAYFYNGIEVARQPIPEEMAGFLDRPEPFHIGGDGRNEARRYRGGIDDLRFYRRALSPDEIRQMMVNVAPTFGHIGTLPFPEGAIHDLRFSRNGELLIAAGGRGAESGKVVIYDVKSGRRQATIGDEYDIVLSADISADHKYVAIGTPAKVVKVYSTGHGKLVHRIEKHTDWVTVVRFSPDGRFLASADRNGGIYVWETENAGIVYTLDEHKVKVTALSWRPDGKVLASAAEDGKFVLWDMKDGWATCTVAAHAERSASRYSRRTGTLDITFATDGRLLTTGRDRSLKRWAAGGTFLGESHTVDSLPLRATTSADGQQAFVGNFNGELQIWDLGTMTRSQVLKLK